MISRWQATFIGLGNIIGAGIFVLAGTAISDAGPGAIIAFVLTAILALTIALNSAELSSSIVSHGGLYSFTKVTMGESAGFVVGWLRAISYAIAASAVAIGFGSYLLSFVNLPYIYILLLAAIVIAVAALIDYHGINTVAKVEHILVFITIGGLILFILISVFYGHWTIPRFTPFVPSKPMEIIEAASLAFFAYSGFNTIATLGPETENPEKSIPFAILVALAVSTILYIIIIFGMLALMPYRDYGITGNPLFDALVFAKAPVAVEYAINIVAIIATFTVTVSLIVAGSRTLLQMSQDRLLPRWIQGREKDSPRRATLLIAGLAIVSLFIGNVQVIALASNFGVIFSYALTGLAVVILRRRNVRGKFRSPLYPFVQILSIALSAVIMFALGERAFYIGTITILVGFMLYFAEKEKVFGKKKKSGSEMNQNSLS
jgi:APA family basic amino acid/polyamine antiporter